MAFANYSTTTDSWVIPTTGAGSLTVAGNSDIVIANHSTVKMTVTTAHSVSSVDNYTFTIEPGEFVAYRPGTAGTMGFTALPAHGGTAAAERAYIHNTQHEETNANLTNTSRLFANVF